MPSEAKPIAVAVVLRDEDVLIGLRPADGLLPGFWEFPGGKVEQGESYQQAVVREVLEETGLRVRIVGEFTPKEYKYAHGRLALRFFRCDVGPDEVLGSVPDRFRWVDRKQLGEFQFPPANDNLLRELSGE